MVFCCVLCLCSFPAHRDGQLCLSSGVIQKCNRAVADRQKAWKDSYRQAGKCLLGVFLHSFYTSFSFTFFLQDGNLTRSQSRPEFALNLCINSPRPSLPLKQARCSTAAYLHPACVSEGFREKLPKITECKFPWKLSGIIQFICPIQNCQWCVGKSQVL